MEVFAGLLGAYDSFGTTGDPLIVAIFVVCIALAIAIWILRSVLRINEMVKYQKSAAEDLAALRKHFDEQEEAAKGEPNHEH